MNDYLTKPFSPEALFKKVSKYYNPASLLQEQEIN
jgi:CheY-like chemotaxis protein